MLRLGKKKKGSSASDNIAEDVQASESAPAGAPMQMMACPSCVSKIPANSKFCPHCGMAISLAQSAADAKNKKEKGKKKRKREIARVAGEKAAECSNDLVGFDFMFEDGIAEVENGVFSATMEFSDISYEHERRDLKNDIFEKFAEVHASFSPSNVYQLTLANMPLHTNKVDRFLPEEGSVEDLAKSYNDIIEDRQRRGRTEFDRRNYLSFSVRAVDIDQARDGIRSLVESVGSKFDNMDVSTHMLTGMERMQLIHNFTRGSHEPFMFSYDRLRNTKKEHARDFVAPAWAVYPQSESSLRRYFMTPGRVVKVFHLMDFGSDLSDRCLRTIRSLPIPMIISLTFCPQPKGKMVARVRQNIDVTQAEKFNYQNKVARSGGDITTLPPALEKREADANELLDYIQDKDEQVSWFQGLITVFADNEEQMEAYERQLLNEQGVWSIQIVELPCFQEPAFTSSLPLAHPVLQKKYRSLSTSEGAALIPFRSQNICDNPKKSLYLGVDSVTGADILIDPGKLKSPHMMCFGMTGGGKSMEINSLVTYAQLQHPRTKHDEATGKWYCPDPDTPQWFIIDWHNEYTVLGNMFDAAQWSFGPAHDSCLSPTDMSNSSGELTLADIRANTDFFLALSESIMGTKLTPREKSIIDRVLNSTYEPFIGKASRPTLMDFFEKLKEEARGRGEDDLVHDLVESFELYTTGSMSSFAGQTNVVDDRQLNIYNMSELGAQMQTIAVLSVLQHVRQAAFRNYAEGRPTYLLFEEAQIVFENEAAVNLLDSYFSEMRKFGLRVILVTQLPNRVLNHPKAANIFENTGLFIFLPNQPANADTIAAMFRLSDSQADRIRPKAPAGTGLIYADGVKIGFNNLVPKEINGVPNLLYKIWNTDYNKHAGEAGNDAEALLRDYQRDLLEQRAAINAQLDQIAQQLNQRVEAAEEAEQPVEKQGEDDPREEKVKSSPEEEKGGEGQTQPREEKTVKGTRTEGPVVAPLVETAAAVPTVAAGPEDQQTQPGIEKVWESKNETQKSTPEKEEAAIEAEEMVEVVADPKAAIAEDPGIKAILEQMKAEAVRVDVAPVETVVMDNIMDSALAEELAAMEAAASEAAKPEPVKKIEAIAEDGSIDPDAIARSIMDDIFKREPVDMVAKAASEVEVAGEAVEEVSAADQEREVAVEPQPAVVERDIRLRKIGVYPELADRLEEAGFYSVSDIVGFDGDDLAEMGFDHGDRGVLVGVLYAAGYKALAEQLR